MRIMWLTVAVLVAGLPLRAGAQVLTLTSPKERQVFQRDFSDTANIKISGTLSQAADRLEARAAPQTTRLGTPVDWTIIATSPTAGGFTGHLRLALGGWYWVEVRAIRGGVAAELKRLERVGIGEVFVTCGQSNSTNYGESRSTVTTDMVSAFDGTNWVLANDPQPGAHDDSNAGSVYPKLGDKLVNYYNFPVAFAATGHGGMKIEGWMTGSTTGDYEWLRDRLLALGENHPRFLLWHQGESNAYPGSLTPENYAANVTGVINRLNSDIGYQLRWITCKATYWPGLWPNATADVIAAQQQLLWSQGTTLQGPDMDSYQVGYRNSGDNIHFNAAGMNIFSDLYKQWITAHINGLGTPTPVAPVNSCIENFETLPFFNSSHEGASGLAIWSIIAGGQSGNCLQATRNATGSSAKVMTTCLMNAGAYNLRVFMKTTALYTSCFWMETAYKTGANSAQDFNENTSTWTMLQKFDGDCGAFPNGQTAWTEYRANNVVLPQGILSMGIKLGGSDNSTYTVCWDSLAITRVDLPTNTPTPLTATPTRTPTNNPLPTGSTATSTAPPQPTHTPTTPPAASPTPNGCALLSQGKPVTASSYYQNNSNYGPSKAVDGVIGGDYDRWVSSTADGTGLGHWLVVDLGAAYELCSAEVYSEESYVNSPGTGDKTFNISGYFVRASNTNTGDPRAWTQLARYEDPCGLPYPDYPGDGVNAHTTDALAGLYRYVAVQIDRGDGDCGPYARVMELKVFGRPANGSPSPTPPIATPTYTPALNPSVTPTRTAAAAATFTPTPAANSPTPAVSPTACLGDADKSGFVNGDDFRAVRDHFGQGACGSGDANGDCFVNGDDFRCVRDHFGMGCQ